MAGHARFQAAHTLSLPHVPVIVLDHLTEVQKRAYILADNKLAENASWDEDLLRLELEALRDEDFDLSLTGFSSLELEALATWTLRPSLTKTRFPRPILSSPPSPVISGFSARTD